VIIWPGINMPPDSGGGKGGGAGWFHGGGGDRLAAVGGGNGGLKLLGSVPLLGRNTFEGYLPGVFPIG